MALFFTLVGCFVAGGAAGIALWGHDDVTIVMKEDQTAEPSVKEPEMAQAGTDEL